MKNLSIFLAALICLLASCESTSYAPLPVTLRRASVGRGQHVCHKTNPSDWQIDLATLRDGRALFVSRCIECHTLPIVSRYDAAEWPELVEKMSKRADLKRSERDAIVAYILAVRAQL